MTSDLYSCHGAQKMQNWVGFITHSNQAPELYELFRMLPSAYGKCFPLPTCLGVKKVSPCS